MESFSSFSSRKWQKAELAVCALMRRLKEVERHHTKRTKKVRDKARERGRDEKNTQTQIVRHLMHIHPVSKVEKNSYKV